MHDLDLPPPGEALSQEHTTEASRIRRKKRRTQSEIEWLAAYEERLQQPLPGGGHVETTTTTTQSVTQRREERDEQEELKILGDVMKLLAQGQQLGPLLSLFLRQMREATGIYKELARQLLEELREERQYRLESDRLRGEAYLAIARARAAQEQAASEEKSAPLIPESTVDGILKGAAKRFGLLEEEPSTSSTTRSTNGEVDPGEVGETLGTALARLQFKDDDIREVLELVQSKYDKLTGE